MPQLGETVAEGKITKWFKSAGDAVKPGDNLFEIETDKVSMEVPSITTGTLTEIKVQVGETALVGAVVAVIAGEGGAAASAPAAPPRPKAPARPPRRKRRPRPSPLSPQQRAIQPSGPLDPFFEVRTPVAQFRSGENIGRHVRHAAGPPARRRERHRSRPHVAAPARTAASSRPMSKSAIAKGGGRAAPHGDRRAAAQVRRSTRASSSRRCRSTACARPSRGGWSRPSRPSRTSISSPT